MEVNELLTMQRLTESQRSKMMDRLIEAFVGFAKHFGIVHLYPSQIALVQILLDSALLDRWDVFIKVARQYGKTEIVTLVLRFLIVFYRLLTGKPFMVGIASPTGEQAKTDIDRIKKTWMLLSNGYNTEDREFSNATIRAYRFGELYAEVYKFSLGPTSMNESKTLNLLIIEEAHKADDEKRSDQLDPMLSSTDGPTWYLGVGSTIENDFSKGASIDAPGRHRFVMTYDDIVKERRTTYDLTRDPDHLNYEKKVGKDIAKKGRGNPEVRRNYFVEDTFEAGSYVTRERLLSCARSADIAIPMESLYFGVDWARRSDHTWGAVTNDFNDVVDWLKVPHARWASQVDTIKEWLKMPRTWLVPQKQEDGSILTVEEEGNYMERIIAVRGDSTGLGDMPMETLQDESELPMDETSHVAFTDQSKNEMYGIWDDALFREKGDPLRFSYPADHELTPEFEEQTTALVREYLKKGGKELLSVHHPKKQGAKDDAPDCTVLGLFASSSGKIQQFL